MNATSTSRAEAPSSAANAGAPTRRIIDAPTRAFHWLLALSFMGAFITAEGERWRMVHVTLGYTVMGLVAFRLLWGILGPRQVRFSTWLGKLRGIGNFVQTLRTGQIAWQAGQNVAQTLAIVALMGVAILITASGYALFNELSGDWLEDVHEVLGDTMMAMVALHVVMVLAGSVLRRQNQAMTMITGRVRGRGPDLVRRNAAPLALALLVGVLAFWAWQWQAAPIAPPERSATAHQTDSAGKAKARQRREH